MNKYKPVHLLNYTKNQYGNQETLKIPFKDVLPNKPIEFHQGIDIDHLTIGCINQSFLEKGISKTFKSVSDEIDRMMKDDRGLNLKQAEEKFEQERFPTPWNFINQMFKGYSNEDFTYCYEVKRPTEIASENLKVHLINKITETEMEFEDLSSGETILLTLTLFVYQSIIKTAFPRVLLLDEIDAVLHPSMCKKLINTIKENFIKNNDCKIILATHNPSTVAFCDEYTDGIFIKNMPDKEDGKIEKQNKSKAIDILTSGFVSVDEDHFHLGIRYGLKKTNLPVLFTEGITDKMILDKCLEFNGLKEEIYVQDCFGASFLGSLFKRETDNSIYDYKKRVFFALFDFDESGYNQWNGLKNGSFEKEIVTDHKKGLCNQHKKYPFYAFLLPVHEYIKSNVENEKEEHQGNRSSLSIEHMFYKKKGFSEYFEEKDGVGGSKMIHFTKNKNVFAEKISTSSTKEDFDNFKPLIETIKGLLAKK